MRIYWREWERPIPTPEELRRAADDMRRAAQNIRLERIEIERLARRIEKAAG